MVEWILARKLKIKRHQLWTRPLEGVRFKWSWNWFGPTLLNCQCVERISKMDGRLKLRSLGRRESWSSMGSLCSHQFQTLRRIILPPRKAQSKTFKPAAIWCFALLHGLDLANAMVWWCPQFHCDFDQLWYSNMFFFFFRFFNVVSSGVWRDFLNDIQKQFPSGSSMFSPVVFEGVF